MTTRREYAASLGLAIANSRGRLSKEAHLAIAEAEKNGMVFSDGKAPAVKAVPIPKPQVTRRAATEYVATLVNGQVIAFDYCAGCKESIQTCACKNGPRPPKWVAPEVASWEAR